jgi:hypothetical protein
MKAITSKFTDFYIRFEKYISAVGLIYGFIFTTLTLTRIDRPLEIFWIVVHLLLAASGILVVTAYENRAKSRNLPEERQHKFKFYLTLVIQFAFGGLFSTFFVFYMRSSSFTESWFFLLILIILLVGNELWKKHYLRLAFQVTVLFLSIYLFLIFFLPVIFHRLGDDLFIRSGILSLVLVAFFTRLLRRLASEKFKNSHHALRTSVLSVFVLMNVLYFTNVIPPIPLSLKNVGAYHYIKKTTDGNYEAQVEPTSWRDYFTRYPTLHYELGETIYAFSAVFSPVKFSTEIIHQWQYFDEDKQDWVDSSRITLPIIGGRDGGFRTYSTKYGAKTGLWRVKVMTTTGQVIGRINFKLERARPDSVILNRVTL